MFLGLYIGLEALEEADPRGSKKVGVDGDAPSSDPFRIKGSTAGLQELFDIF